MLETLREGESRWRARNATAVIRSRDRSVACSFSSEHRVASKPREASYYFRAGGLGIR